MSLIDATYFVGELNIPNTGQAEIAEQVTWFINKYEPIFLQKLFGYPLYKSFVASMNTPAPEQRFLDILYGKEYTDYQGRIQKWKGLVKTDSPVFNLSGGLSYKKPEYLKAGVTPDFTAGINSVTFPDWIGWTPIITRTGVMKPGTDYSWDIDTGELTLLAAGDKFGNGEDFFVAFDQRTDGSVPVLDLSANESCIANYVYLLYRKSNVSQFTGIGEVITNAENSYNISPRKKAAAIWNLMHEWVREFCAFMEVSQVADPTTYPEWTLADEHIASKTFAFMNPNF